MTEIVVPTLGESVSEATVATWFKKMGDRVIKDEMLCELETDKVTVEVPSTVSGVLKEIIAPEGTTVGLSAILAVIDETKVEEALDEPLKTPSENMKKGFHNSKEETSAATFNNAPSARKIMEERMNHLL